MGPANEKSNQTIDVSSLTGVPQTLLLPLYYRALDFCHRRPLLGDPLAVEILDRLRLDMSTLKGQAHDRVLVMMRAKEFDRRTRAFLAGYPNGTVIEIGCGLDTRFHRVDNGCVSWYDLDLPEVMDIRRRVLDASSRCRFIASSVHDFSWMDRIAAFPGSPVLILTEGVLMYLDEEQVKALVRALRGRFPGSELICDAFSRFFVRISLWFHPAIRRMHAAPRWGFQRSSDLESWAEGVRVLDEWRYFNQPERRLGLMRLFRIFPPVANGARILHCLLGKGPDHNAGCVKPRPLSRT